MIKVCHVTSVHSEEDVRIFHKECCSLSKNGYETYLVQQGESYEKNGVHIAGFGTVATNRLKRMLLTSRVAYKKALEVDADIYHLHDPELLPYALKLKRKGKKVIFDSHEHTAEAILEKEWLPVAIRKAVYYLYDRYQKFVCRRIDGIISVTPNIVRYFKECNTKTYQVANYPILGTEQETTKEKSNRLVFAGGISRQWNHHVILKALEMIPECRYCLCGSSGQYLETLKQLPAWTQVDYMGEIPHAQVANELSRSAIGMALLSPGRNTDWQNGTMGNTKIFEEMMAGLPVICTDFVLWRDFVDRYHCGICVDPQNADQIAEAIRYLIDNPEEAKQMGENGRRAVKEEFSWSVEEKTLLALYEDILNKEN